VEEIDKINQCTDRLGNIVQMQYLTITAEDVGTLAAP